MVLQVATDGEGGILANGNPLHIKGVVWHGPEDGPHPPYGLHAHPLDWYLQFLVDHNFNAIRVLFNHADVLANPVIDLTGLDHASPTFVHGMRYIDMLGAFARAAGKKGLAVVLSCSRTGRVVKADTDGGGLWFDEDVKEVQVVRSWLALAADLCPLWNVIGTDLQDAPVCARPQTLLATET